MERKIESARARDILGCFRGRRFLVVGDLMLDRYVFGDVERISPEAPVPVVKVTRTEERLGGAANVANNLAALGADVSLCGVVGDDDDGEAVFTDLGGGNIDTTLLVRDPGRPTTRKVRIIAHQQQVVRVDHEHNGPIGPDVEKQLIRNISGRIGAMDGVILSDYGKGVVGTDTIRAIVDGAGKKVKTFVDPKVRHFSMYRGVSLVTPNLAEASLAAGEKIVDDGSLMRAGARLLELLPGTTILLTRGADGMSLFEPNGLVTHIGTYARKVFDVTGAGDTVIATFAMAVTSGAVGIEAAILANLAAGRVVQESGAATVSVDALDRAFEEE